MDYVMQILSKRDKRGIAPRVVCADGFSLSVQASQYHYCSPKTNNGPYDAVEVGFLSEHEPLLAPYQDDETDVFAFVPVNVVNAIIEKHGGISENLFKSRRKR